MSSGTDLFSFLQAQSIPLTAAQVAKAVKGQSKAVTAELDALAQSGRITAFALGKGTGYAARPPLDMAAEALAALVRAQSEPQMPAKLRGKLPKALQPWFDEALGRLIVRGQAYWFPKGKARLVSGRAIRPSDTLTPAHKKAISQVLAEANRHRAASRTLEHFVAWLDDTETKATGRSATLTVAQLFAWYAEDRARSSTSSIPIPHTYRRYEEWSADNGSAFSPSTFKQLLSELYDAGKVILEPCERPQELPAAERELQVPLRFGPPGYYWCPVQA